MFMVFTKRDVHSILIHKHTIIYLFVCIYVYVNVAHYICKKEDIFTNVFIYRCVIYKSIYNNQYKIIIITDMKHFHPYLWSVSPGRQCSKHPAGVGADVMEPCSLFLCLGHDHHRFTRASADSAVRQEEALVPPAC